MVRIWRVPVELLDRQHLLGEHVELHVIFNAIQKEENGIKAGWQHHPQTIRFKGHIGMLIDRHNQQIEEMENRGYKHNSPLVVGKDISPESYTYSLEECMEDMEVLYSRQSEE